MLLALAIIAYILIVTLLIAAIYVCSTYLLLAYDRSLAKAKEVEPGYVDSDDFPRKRGCWKGLFGEVLATCLFILLFPIGVMLRHYCRDKGRAGRPIILVHGFKHNQSAWFWMRKRLRQAGLGPIYSLNLYTSRGSIERFAQRIAKLVDKVDRENGPTTQIVLVGHSMGGLVSAYYAEHIAPAGKVSHVITLGAPLQGTRSALLAGSHCAQQMRPGSSFLRELHPRLTSGGAITYCQIGSQFDNIIFPHQAALIGPDIGQQRVLAHHGHLSLLFSRTVSRQIVDWLRVAAPVGPTADRVEQRFAQGAV